MFEGGGLDPEVGAGGGKEKRGGEVVGRGEECGTEGAKVRAVAVGGSPWPCGVVAAVSVTFSVALGATGGLARSGWGGGG